MTRPLIHSGSCIANANIKYCIDVLDQTWRGEVWSRKCVLLLELGIGSHLSNPITGAWWHLTPHTQHAALQHCRHCRQLIRCLGCSHFLIKGWALEPCTCHMSLMDLNVHKHNTLCRYLYMRWPSLLKYGDSVAWCCRHATWSTHSTPHSGKIGDQGIAMAALQLCIHVSRPGRKFISIPHLRHCPPIPSDVCRHYSS